MTLPRRKWPIPTGLRLSLWYGWGIAKMLRRRPECFNLGELIADFPAWRQSQNHHRNSIDDEQPWIAFAAIRKLEAVIQPHFRVFEYGAGGSTLFLARRAAEVISIEHDRDWAERVSAALKQRGLANVWLRHIPSMPDAAASEGNPANPDDYVSLDKRYDGHSFRDYAASINGYPDQSFDLVLIDGRARPSCFAHTLPKVRNEGYIVFDNTSRSYYRPVFRRAAAQFSQLRLAGSIPYQRHFDETTFFQKRAGS